MGSVMVSLYKMPPESNSTSSPYRSASRLCSTSSCTSPMSWTCISPSVSFQTTWSWGSSSSSRCELAQRGVDVRPLGQQHPIAEDGLQHGAGRCPAGPPAPSPGRGPGQAGDGAHLPGPRPPRPACILRRSKAAAGLPFRPRARRPLRRCSWALHLQARRPSPAARSAARPARPWLSLNTCGPKGFQRRGRRGCSASRPASSASTPSQLAGPRRTSRGNTCRRATAAA